MKNKTCLVTGASSGIGYATAHALAGKGATVVLLCRNREKGEAACEKIKIETGNTTVNFLTADLASQASIRDFAAAYKSKFNHLHLLINNAGTISHERKVTVDGIEEMLAVNYLSHFLLTNLLLDVLKESAPSRIINIVGRLHTKGVIDFYDFQAEKNFNMMQVGCDRVLAKTIFSHELARRLEGTGVTVNCMHPGAVRTNLQRKLPWYFSLLARPISLFFQSPQKAAEQVLFLGTAAELEDTTRKYFNKKREERSSEDTYDPELAKKLWDVSEELTGM